MTTKDAPPAPAKGRGATFNPANRFRADARAAYDDGWPQPGEPGDEPPPPIRTVVTIQRARTIIAHNDSPDVPFTQSVNPYQGCEHGCIYCFARPSHAYLDLSPGIDFETKLFAKPDAANLLRAELAKPGYRCDPIALGTNTDPYQPIEREWKVTRSVLEVLALHEHPFTIVTKSALVERDIDLIAPMAQKRMARVYLSVTTLDRALARRMEPRAAAPHRRLQALKTLADAGIPVGVMVAPVIPQLNDRDLEAILEAAAAHGAQSAGWVLLRLPREVAPLFREWLDAHYPLRAGHVVSLVQQMRGGRDYDSAFGTRMRGNGALAALLERRFAIACRRLGLNRGREHIGLDVSRFRPPRPDAAERQGELFAEPTRLEPVRDAAVDESRARIVIRWIEPRDERRQLVGRRRIAVEQVLHAERQLPVPKARIRALQVPQAQRADRARVALEVRILVGIRGLVRLREHQRPRPPVPRDRRIVLPARDHAGRHGAERGAHRSAVRKIGVLHVVAQVVGARDAERQASPRLRRRAVATLEVETLEDVAPAVPREDAGCAARPD